METPADSTVIAAIDVGTNSIHMIVARLGPGGFDILAREKNVVRLGSGGGQMTRLADDAMDRGVAALTHMRAVAEAHGAEIRAVATSAVREADNADDFLARCRTDTGVEVRVISGMEEARLIHLGVRMAVPTGDETVLLVDIGGGSTEIVVSRSGHILFAQSLKIGAVRLTDRFFPDGEVSEAAVASCRGHASSTVAAIAHEVRRLSPTRTILSSGTAETIARLSALSRDTEAPLSMNMHAFDASDVSEALAVLLDCRDRTERARLPGVDDRRADIIVAGAILLESILGEFGVESVVFSEYALREGVLVDAGISLGVVDPSATVDNARDAVLMLARRCSVDLDHAGRVASHSAALLAGLSGRVDVPADAGRILEAAAYLCNVGLAVSHSRHHVHAYYIVRNSDLMGFDDTEIEMIALVCRYHRKGHPKHSQSEFARLDPHARAVVSLLAGILRVATALDRSHDGAVSSVALDTGAATPTVLVTGDASRPKAVALDVYTARERVDLLAACLGADVDVRLLSDG